MIIRLHCKHGVVKTHELVLLTTTDLLAPRIISSPNESRITVGPRALRDILEHFPHNKGTKSDPQLVWLFGPRNVKVKSLQVAADAKGGKSQISTEISMSADEFDYYSICQPPVSLGFHLREFNATISLAEFLSVALDFRFTEATEPIYIEFDTDSADSEFLFVISTTESVYDDTAVANAASSVNLRKRDREDGAEEDQTMQAESSSRVTKKKSQRAVVKTTSVEHSQAMSRQNTSQFAASRMASREGTVQQAMTQDVHVQPEDDFDNHQDTLSGAPEQREEPLFMPGASQLSNVDIEILRGAGLGIEHMDYDEFEAMMEADGEEVGMSTKIVGNRLEGRAAWEEDESETQISMSQLPTTQIPSRDGDFRPLFED
ncbi:hypothetical protein M422DRAFT_205489 [Sphaerobolus stellatus SS14]|nr:hypothetical protein M422DRAFT_205489 [Sphaerobolus stellatus SS14]